MRHRGDIGLVLAAATLATAVTTGGCGSAAFEPITVGLGCPEQPLRGPDGFAGEPAAMLIDDFEDGDAMLAPISGRDGAWVLGTDGSQGMLVARGSGDCAARGRAAGHFAGTGFTTWGSNWTAVFRSANGGPAVPHDARNYGAISFWAARGPGAVAPFDLPVGVTTVDNAWNGGVCTSMCMDYYGTRVALTPRWQRYVIRLDDLAQNGWGIPQVAMRKNMLVGFIMWPNHAFDVWIDDVRFEPL